MADVSQAPRAVHPCFSREEGPDAGAEDSNLHLVHDPLLDHNRSGTAPGNQDPVGRVVVVLDDLPLPHADRRRARSRGERGTDSSMHSVSAQDHLQVIDLWLNLEDSAAGHLSISDR